MKRTLIYTGIGIVAALLFLFIFNKATTKSNKVSEFAEAMQGEFEISLSATGELLAEKSVDIMGPSFEGRRDVRSSNIKITDLIPEGTMVKEGDYIATLDKTELDNDLKNQRERLATFEVNVEMKLLDSAVLLNSLRDQIRNQKYTVQEAEITLRNSKYEPPTRLRQAEIDLDKSQRVLEQLERSYIRRQAQASTDIYNTRYYMSRIGKRVSDLEEVLEGFTITAPSDGMVIYKREWRGNKRKIGSNINPMDRAVATLPDLSALISKTFVSEVDVSKVKEGQSVRIKVDAFPEKAYTGKVLSVAQIGEKLPNTNENVFEVIIKLDYTDPILRPSMTTSNKIILKTVSDAVFIPIECVLAGTDSVPFVYTKNGTKQIVIVAGSTDKNIRIEEGLEPGTMVYTTYPERPDKFKVEGEELIPVIKQRAKEKRDAFLRSFQQAGNLN